MLWAYILPHNGGLEAMRKALDRREEKTPSTKSLVELEECVLKNNVLNITVASFGKKLAQKMVPSYSILFMADLEERLLESSELKPSIYLHHTNICLLYTSPSPRDLSTSRMPSSA